MMKHAKDMTGTPKKVSPKAQAMDTTAGKHKAPIGKPCKRSGGHKKISMGR